MKNAVNFKLLSILITCFSIQYINAQLGFCNGNSGEPIFVEDFGTAPSSVTQHTVLPSGTTTYGFLGNPPVIFADGLYTVSNMNYQQWNWFNQEDHTEGDQNGRMLVVNASFTAGEFYRLPISGLCENTTYEFSSWLMNLTPRNLQNGGVFPNPCNVSFQIWDSTDTTMLKSGTTGDFLGSLSTEAGEWLPFALVFTTVPGQNSVILKMVNNGMGGYGNDVAIDDIVFKSCGDTVNIIDTLGQTQTTLCEDQIPFNISITATPDFTIFSSHFYQWQESTDGVNWVDMPTETNNTLSVSVINTMAIYRVKVAEDIVNINNDLCNTISDTYEINVTALPLAPVSKGDVEVCENDTHELSVTVPNGITVTWFDAPIAGNNLATNALVYTPTSEGIYYAEAESINNTCKSTSRTAVALTFIETPEVADEKLILCPSGNLTLDAAPINPSIVTSYLWSTGETTQTINIFNAGTYTVEVANGICDVTKTIEVTATEIEGIENVSSDGNDIVVTSSNQGDFIYSIDGTNFQASNIFRNVKGGQYTIYARELNCNELFTFEHLHFYIPKFFTPNNDSINDTFDLSGLELYTNSSVSIFNRYGKLLKFTKNSTFSWNGTYAGTLLPADDYWYVISINDQKLTGYFTLKR